MPSVEHVVGPTAPAATTRRALSHLKTARGTADMSSIQKSAGLGAIVKKIVGMPAARKAKSDAATRAVLKRILAKEDMARQVDDARRAAAAYVAKNTPAGAAQVNATMVSRAAIAKALQRASKSRSAAKPVHGSPKQVAQGPSTVEPAGAVSPPTPMWFWS